MKAIIFDMDGLIIDTEKLYFECHREIARSYGKTVKESTLWKMMGRKSEEAHRILIDETGLNATTADTLKKRDQIMIKKYHNELDVIDGFYDIINFFHNKKKFAIATGAPKLYLDIVIDKLNFKDIFDAFVCSDNIKNGKPDPEIYLKAIEKLGLKPSDCIVLEDSSNGARSGKNAGCYTIGVLTEYTKHQDFSFVDYKAKNLIDAFEHLKKI